VGAAGVHPSLGFTPSDLFWVSSAQATDRVGNVFGMSFDVPQKVIQLAGVHGSELAIDGKYLYLSNIDSGVMSRMVR
jgi:hypothetical protein